MPRRPSGTPIEHADEQAAAEISSSRESGAITDERHHTLHVEVPAQAGEWNKKLQNLESSPRARVSASWRRQLATGSTSETSTDKVLMAGEGKSSDSMADNRGALKSRTRSPWSCSLLTAITAATAVVFLLAIIHSAVTRQLDPQGCVMSRMSPTYIKLSGFDTEHTRFATKYSLYLYREEGVDEYSQNNIGLRGVPVLFLPGNAGSYKQVRSLSSEASRYFHDHIKRDQKAMRSGVSSLDFFTIDFNEDLAAFHGQTLLDQAEYANEAVAYILSLYTDPKRSQRDSSLPDPSSVILIGHSMGGIVARSVLVTPNYQSNSVNTIITMSTPHARPPVSFDADIVFAYKRMNDFWRDSYSQERPSNNPLRYTTLISIAGGGLDTTVPSDYASLSSLVPETHGFTVFTSTIPDVWTGMDHLAITWADQIRKVIVKSLFDTIDVRRPSQTKPRPERMRTFRKWYLTGLEESAPKSMPGTEPSVLLTLGDSSRSTISQTRNLTLPRLGTQKETIAKLLPIPMAEKGRPRTLTLLTDQPMDPNGEFENIQVLFCSAFPLQSSQSSAQLGTDIDLSDGSSGFSRLACKRPAGDAIHLPASTRTSKFSFEQVSPFTYLQYKLEDLADHQFLAIVDQAIAPSGGWVFAEIADIADSTLHTNVGLRRLLLRGLHIELPAQRPMMMDIKVPALHSSLLAFSLHLKSQGCGADSELFTPLLRQYINAPHESKYFVNFKQGDINLHGEAPFMPPTLGGVKPSDGVSFQIWSDPTCDASLDFSLRIDLAGSIGKLVVRYRTVFAAFPLLVVAMVLRKQFRVYDTTGIYITFFESLDQSLRKALPVLLLSMTFFATAFSSSKPSDFGFQTTANGTEVAVDYTQNDLLLGSQDTFFWFLVPLAGLISIGGCVLLNYLALTLVYALSAVQTLLTNKSGPVGSDDTKRYIPGFVASSPRRRIINTIVLLLLVSTVIPYQFAFLVACIIQLATCTRALSYTSDNRSGQQHNFFNYAHSVFILMLWVLPLHLPTLVVWVHNLAVHWLTPFSSHHNVLSIMPFIFLVETMTSGSMVPRMANQVKWITNVLFFVLAVYAAVYGVTYAYRLHYLANIVALWLVVLHFSVRPGFSFSGISSLFEAENDLETADVKKRP
jgi:glycosylphosphatidylinositol deacylase